MLMNTCVFRNIFPIPDDAVDWRKLGSQLLILNSGFRPHSNFYLCIRYTCMKTDCGNTVNMENKMTNLVFVITYLVSYVGSSCCGIFFIFPHYSFVFVTVK